MCFIHPGRGGRISGTPSTHVSLHYHVVFSTKGRLPLIAAPWRVQLHEYLGGCVRGLGGHPVQIGGIADHVHLLIGLKATHAPAEVVREIKKASTSWVRETQSGLFQWQEGYGAFTVSRRDVASVDEYVRTQENHHRARSFQDEYLGLLDGEGIEFDPRYLW